MNLKEQLDKDYIEAFKSKNELTISVLRMLKSSMKNKEIALGKPLDDTLIAELLQKEVKQRKDSAAQYKDGGRPELAEKEELEIAIINKYLPEQLSREKITEIVDAAMVKTGATGPQDIGKLMGAIMPEVKGKADGSLVSEIVKEKLNNK